MLYEDKSLETVKIAVVGRERIFREMKLCGAVMVDTCYYLSKFKERKNIQE